MDEGDGSYPSEEEEEEEEERIPTDISAEGVELIASYWCVHYWLSYVRLCYFFSFGCTRMGGMEQGPLKQYQVYAILSCFP